MGGREWLVTRVGVGLGGVGGAPAPVMVNAGSDSNAINAGTACVAGSAGNAGGDGVVSDARVEWVDEPVEGCPKRGCADGGCAAPGTWAADADESV